MTDDLEGEHCGIIEVLSRNLEILRKSTVTSALLQAGRAWV
jgi:hypothetical protein